MLDLLADAQRELPALLIAPGWQGLRIDYETPHVDRAWRPWRDGRLNIHLLHPCERPLYHPHPWPSAMRVLSGRYEMGIGHGASKPPIAARMVLTAGATYEMTDPDAWHYVRPLEPTLTIMLTGKPWPAPHAPKPPHPLASFDPADLLALAAARL